MEPRWYQNDAVQSVFDYYIRGNVGNPLVALPTGTGKSLVQALLMARILAMWPRQRFICLTHVKELIEQNAAEMIDVWPTAPIGIYSAGLDKRVTHAPIVYGGVASVVNNISAFGWRDLMLVDEAHLMSGKDDSQYGKVIAGLREVNPHMKVIGFTATPYRTGQGMLTDGGVFTDICFDMTTMAAFNLLIEQGYLAPVQAPSRLGVEIDVTGVDLSNNKEVEAASDHDRITAAALREACQLGFTRRSWLTFAAGIKHATHINDWLNGIGVPSGIVHGEMSKDERNATINKFKDGALRNIVNYGVLTTGFNHKPIDMIIMLRPTKSTGLWVQMLGRGTRVFPGKDHCLVLDYAGNTKRLGPINDPMIPAKRGQKGGGVVPIKICPECGYFNHTRATQCCNCTHIFVSSPKITGTASTDELLRTESPQVEYFDVSHTTYAQAQKREVGSSPYLRVSYYCGALGMQKFDERVMLEHTGAAKRIARDWWRTRYIGDGTARRPASFAGYVPDSIAESLQLTNYLKQPRRILVQVNLKHPEIKAHIW